MTAMVTGVTYMGHQDPTMIDIDMREMEGLGIDDVLVAAQENDFHYFPGKIEFTPRIALDHGIRPIAIFWGALNLFGGGRSSQYLLNNPSGFQVKADGSHHPEGCYVNRDCVSHIKGMIDTIANHGYAGYFVDEPTPLRECYCRSCCERYDQWYGGSLHEATEEKRELFRQRCVVEYVREVADYCKAEHPGLETMCCLMPHDDALWKAAADIESLDNLGTDLYWVNNDQDVREMMPAIGRLSELCGATGKKHHEWLQCWNVRKGREQRVFDQGEVMVGQRPDALYVWAWKGQQGTNETCDDPEASWKMAVDVLKLAKEG